MVASEDSPAPDLASAIAAEPDMTSTPFRKEKKEKPGALDRLKSLAGRSRKDKKIDIPKAQNKDAAIVAAASAGTAPDPATVPPTELVEGSTATGSTPAPANPVPPVEPSVLAKLIQSLIDALPPLSPNDPIPKPKPVRKGPDGKPLPPPNSTPIKDPKVIAQLSSPAVMNGSVKSGRRIRYRSCEVRITSSQAPGSG